MQNKTLVDCYWFLKGACTKGSECGYRHSEAALVNPTSCVFWFSGRCTKPDCGFRHPPITPGMPGIIPGPIPGIPFNIQGNLPTNRKEVPCYYLSQPGGCKKGSDCPFSHALVESGSNDGIPKDEKVVKSEEIAKKDNSDKPKPKAPPKSQVQPSIAVVSQKDVPTQETKQNNKRPPLQKSNEVQAKKQQIIEKRTINEPNESALDSTSLQKQKQRRLERFKGGIPSKDFSKEINVPSSQFSSATKVNYVKTLDELLKEGNQQKTPAAPPSVTITISSAPKSDSSDIIKKRKQLNQTVTNGKGKINALDSPPKKVKANPAAIAIAAVNAVVGNNSQKETGSVLGSKKTNKVLNQQKQKIGKEANPNKAQRNSKNGLIHEKDQEKSQKPDFGVKPLHALAPTAPTSSIPTDHETPKSTQEVKPKSATIPVSVKRLSTSQERHATPQQAKLSLISDLPPKPVESSPTPSQASKEKINTHSEDVEIDFDKDTGELDGDFEDDAFDDELNEILDID